MLVKEINFILPLQRNKLNITYRILTNFFFKNKPFYYEFQFISIHFNSFQF